MTTPTPPNETNDLNALANEANAAHPEARVILHLVDFDPPRDDAPTASALLAEHVVDWNLATQLPNLQPAAQVTVGVILQSLLHDGLTQNQKCVPLELANQLAAAFIAHFDDTAACYTNAHFGRDDYSDFFLASWDPLFQSPMDAGVLLITHQRAGLLWIAI
jgi:hypothetical protein